MTSKLMNFLYNLFTFLIIYIVASGPLCGLAISGWIPFELVLYLYLPLLFVIQESEVLAQLFINYVMFFIL